MQRFHGTCEPVPHGGGTSPLEEYAHQILALNRERPDLTLDEIVLALHKRRISWKRSALSRFFARHGIIFKKKPARRRAKARRRGSRTPMLDPRAKVAWPCSSYIFRRNCRHYEHCPSQRSEPTRRTAVWRCFDGALGNADIHRRLSPTAIVAPMLIKGAVERRSVSRLSNNVSPRLSGGRTSSSSTMSPYDDVREAIG
jgi:hypothetical protein